MKYSIKKFNFLIIQNKKKITKLKYYLIFKIKSIKLKIIIINAINY